jgi:hypothetical protein
MKDPRPGRHLVKVLCTFRGWFKAAGSSVSFVDSVMIKVERHSEIPEAFQWEMKRRLRMASPFTVGPVPKFWELLSYLPEHGRRRFDIDDRSVK